MVRHHRSGAIVFPANQGEPHRGRAFQSAIVGTKHDRELGALTYCLLKTKGDNMSNPPEHDHGVWPPAPNSEASAKRGGPEPPSWYTRLADAPPEMVLFAAFSAVVGVGQLWLTFLGPKLWREVVAPYTGPNGFMLYLFCLVLASQLIFAPDGSPKAHRGITAILLLSGAFGLGFYLFHGQRYNFHNPYLMVSPWQPVLTVGLPLAWAVALGIRPAIRGRKA